MEPPVPVGHLGVSVALSPDRRRLALGTGAGFQPDENGVLVLWDLVAGVEERRVPVPSGGVGLDDDRLIQFTPDGHALVVGQETNAVGVYDLSLRRTGWLALSTADHAPGSIVVGDRLLSWGDRGLVLAPMVGDRWSDGPDSKWLAAGFSLHLDKSVVVGGRVVGPITEDDGRSSVIALDLEADREAWSTDVPMNTSSSYASSADGHTLVVATNERVHWIDTTTGTERATTPLPSFTRVVLDPQGRGLAAVDWRGGPALLGTAEGPLATLPTPLRREPLIDAPDLRSLAYSPDGKQVLVATADGALEVYTVEGTPRRTAHIAVTNDAEEWLGALWGADDTIVGITSIDVVLAGLGGDIRARLPIGVPIGRWLPPAQVR